MGLQLSYAETEILLDILKNKYYPDRGLYPKKGYLLDQIISRLVDQSTVLFPGPLDELNYEIMYLLGDEELFTACKLNMKTAELCRNEQFWRNRILRVYGIDPKKYMGPQGTYTQLYRQLSDPRNNKLYIAIENGITPLVEQWYPDRKIIEEDRSEYLVQHKLPTATLHIEDFVVQTIYNGHISIIRYIFDNMTDSTKKKILDKIKFSKIAQNGQLEMFNYLLDQAIYLKLKGYDIWVRESSYEYIYNNNHNLKIIHQILDKSIAHDIIDSGRLYDILTSNRDYDYIAYLMESNDDYRSEFFSYWRKNLNPDNIDYNLAELMLAGTSEQEILAIEYNLRIVLDIWYKLNLSMDPNWKFPKKFLEAAIKQKVDPAVIKYISDHGENSPEMDNKVNKIVEAFKQQQLSKYRKIDKRRLVELAEKNGINPNGSREELLNRLLDAGIRIGG